MATWINFENLELPQSNYIPSPGALALYSAAVFDEHGRQQGHMIRTVEWERIRDHIRAMGWRRFRVGRLLIRITDPSTEFWLAATDPNGNWVEQAVARCRGVLEREA